MPAERHSSGQDSNSSHYAFNYRILTDWLLIDWLIDYYLEDGEHGLIESVEVVPRYGYSVVEAELAAKQLHAEQREDDDEQEQK